MADKKPEAAPAPAAAEKAAAPAAAPAAGGGGGIKALLPAILAIVLAPALTFAVAQFVLLPKFRASVAAAAGGEGAAEAHEAPAAKHGESAEKPAKKEAKEAAKGGHGGGGKGKEAAATGEGYRFENVVVNLAGTMGTRYLKTSFLVTGRGDIIEKFDGSKPQLTDVTLAVLSSLTLADLEEAGSKNIIRERLLAAFNQTLGAKIAENLYFSEFVIQ